MSQSIESSQTVRVWLGNREVERPIDRIEIRERSLYGGCPEVIKVAIPKLEAGETVMRWRNRILIVRQSAE